MENLIQFLKQKSSEKIRCKDEDFSAYDWFGGNVDDAYYGGMDDGESSLVWDILHKFFPEHVEKND